MSPNSVTRFSSHAFLAGLLFGNLCAVGAQTSPPAPPVPSSKSPAPQAGGPAWKDLSTAQRGALAPLAGQWETLGAEQKQKWLEVSAAYPRLTPDAQQRVQQRMGEFARLSPEQRVTARENFRRAYELPANERHEKLQRYQDLPEDKKRTLSEQAGKKKAPPADAPAAPAPVPPSQATPARVPPAK